MAFNFTFADNQRLGLQIVGAKSTGTSEQPLGFKRIIVDADNNVAGEVMYMEGSDNYSNFQLGICRGYYCDGKTFNVCNSAGAPIFGAIFKDKSVVYLQTGGVAYVQTDGALTEKAKVYLIPSSGKISSSSSGNLEIKGAMAGNPANKINIKIRGTPTDLYPIYLNNPHL